VYKDFKAAYISGCRACVVDRRKRLNDGSGWNAVRIKVEPSFNLAKQNSFEDGL